MVSNKKKIIKKNNIIKTSPLSRPVLSSLPALPPVRGGRAGRAGRAGQGGKKGEQKKKIKIKITN